MNIDTARTLIESSAIVAVMRGNFPPEIALSVAQTLLECDISIFELTVNSEQPFEAMRALKREFGMNAAVGMGTVLDVDNAQRALDEGADFVVAPSFSREVVRLVLDAGVMMIPGVMTPSECVDAWALGVPLLKLFPAGALGLEYFKSIIAPLSHMRFMCNGGINDSTTREFLKAGALACGAAGWLTGDGSTPLSTIRQRGQMLRDVVKEVHTGQIVRKV